MAVTYNRVNWVNGTTAVSATNMNNMDKGIDDCATELNAIESALGDAAGADIGTGADEVAAGNHNHDTRYYTQSEVDDMIGNINLTSHNHDERYYKKTEIDNALAGKAPTTHDHDTRYYTKSYIDTALAGKASSNHNHDSRYYTESEVNSMLGDLQAQINQLKGRVAALEHGGGNV